MKESLITRKGNVLMKTFRSINHNVKTILRLPIRFSRFGNCCIVIVIFSAFFNHIANISKMVFANKLKEIL